MTCHVDSEITGAGIGLRACHYRAILEQKPNIPWLEALSDNYFNDPIQLEYLKEIRKYYPMTLHGVGLSIGSTDPLDYTYLEQLKLLANTIDASFISDHLSWSSVNTHHLHDLLPLPFTQEAIRHVSERIKQVQDYLGQRILIENASSYLAYKCDQMTEWDFINEIVNQADCYILLDVNNIYVSAFNQGFTPEDYLSRIDASRVKYYHLAGFSDEGTYLFDKHNQQIHGSVWSLYEAALKQVGVLPTLIERDADIPPLATLQAEAMQADRMMQQIEVAHA